MLRNKFENILFWAMDVFGYSVGTLLVPGILLLFSEILAELGQAYYNLLESIGAWIFAPFLVIGILIKVVRDRFKSGIYENKDLFTEKTVITSIIICGLVGMGFLNKLINENANNTKSIYVYACPTNEATKCYELQADKIECTYNGEDGCEEWETTIYFPNGGNLFLTCSSAESNKLLCSDEDDKGWEIQETGEKTEELK